ncbi:hypothetical protein CHS0354_001961 [Potamilus streckersoni]|uniref:ABC transmembrane type-1 domain-containing protein n=1 Tax=Potamilus streckersoni TaxID=2493646 RepID=A0AAE0W7P4_9BIVA|nr:hypothetical protein CHS0354_001961 [Potamilus streckersoni]
MMSYNLSRRIGLIFLGVLGFFLALLYLSPFYLVIINSFKSKREVVLDTLALPEQLLWENYAKALEKLDLFRTFTNSVIITVGSILLIMMLSSMCAWMLVRTKNKVSTFIFYIFVAGMLIPFQSVMLPLVRFMGEIGMLNSRTGIILMYGGFGSSMAIFLYHGFIKNIPAELEQAALIDGCSKWQIYRYIVFPLLRPIHYTVAILNVLWIWNDYLLPALMLQDNAVRTIPLQMQYFFGAYSKDWQLAMAALLLSMLPIIIFYLFAQKHIIKGIMAGSVK